VLSDLFILRGVPAHIRSDNVLCREAAGHVRPRVSIASLG
jgi:putative transposase